MADKELMTLMLSKEDCENIRQVFAVELAQVDAVSEQRVKETVADAFKALAYEILYSDNSGAAEVGFCARRIAANLRKPPKPLAPVVSPEDQACIDTIAHWTEDVKRLKLFGGDETFPQVFNNLDCPLCLMHHYNFRAHQHKYYCGICPLSDGLYGCGYGSPFNKAAHAAEKGDKAMFRAAQSEILRRVRNGLSKPGKPKTVTQVVFTPDGEPRYACKGEWLGSDNGSITPWRDLQPSLGKHQVYKREERDIEAPE